MGALRSLGEVGRLGSMASTMYYVYMLGSISHPTQRYVGFTEDLKTRLQDHNDGKNVSTKPCKPWSLETYLAFSSKKQALAFESYLKTGSGFAFANKRLWT